MNPDEIFEHMRKMTGQHQQQSVSIPVEKLDTFIDRCIAEKDETLYSLGQALNFKLQMPYDGAMISIPEAQVYPRVIKRINERLQKERNNEKL